MAVSLQDTGLDPNMKRTVNSLPRPKFLRTLARHFPDLGPDVSWQLLDSPSFLVFRTSGDHGKCKGDTEKLCSVFVFQCGHAADCKMFQTVSVVVKVIWQQAAPPRMWTVQCHSPLAPVCTPMLLWAHPSKVLNGISIGSAVFAQLTHTVSPYFTMDCLPLKTAPFPLGIWTPSNIWFVGPIWVLDTNIIWIHSAIFCRAHYCGRQTDQQITLLNL